MAWAVCRFKEGGEELDEKEGDWVFEGGGGGVYTLMHTKSKWHLKTIPDIWYLQNFLTNERFLRNLISEAGESKHCVLTSRASECPEQNLLIYSTTLFFNYYMSFQAWNSLLINIKVLARQNTRMFSRASTIGGLPARVIIVPKIPQLHFTPLWHVERSSVLAFNIFLFFLIFNWTRAVHLYDKTIAAKDKSKCSENFITVHLNQMKNFCYWCCLNLYTTKCDFSVLSQVNERSLLIFSLTVQFH